ncbi:hypothetical protein JHK85_010231 [Glycine max]|nr:hypothetical protein JHK85_010231 [Glycine max]
METPSACWDKWVGEALATLHSLKVLRSVRPICLRNSQPLQFGVDDGAFQVFDEMQQWDRSSVEVEIAETTFSRWMHDTPSSGDEIVCSAAVGGDEAGASYEKFKKLILFSGNDYLGLSSHPTIGKAAAKAAQEHGMGPRGSALICGYTNYHRLLESSLADLKKKEDCLLCPTGFAANMALMTAIGSIGTLLAGNRIPSEDEKIAVFSDALNHASIIDGIRLAERQKSVKDPCCGKLDLGDSHTGPEKEAANTKEEILQARGQNNHLSGSILNAGIGSPADQSYIGGEEVHRSGLWNVNAVILDLTTVSNLFSMDGDYAPMVELADLRKKHGFLLVIDDAHGTFVCGKNGGGVAEEFNCEKDVDICIGTLSKAAGCHGGFIACR